MENHSNKNARLLSYFADHLNRICCAKTHMVHRFPEVAALATYNDLKKAIRETTEDVNNQILRMNIIFDSLGIKQDNANCSGMLGMLDEALESIQSQTDDKVFTDLSILFYMQNIESIETTSFRILHLMAVQLKNPEVSQLLLENYDEAKDDQALLALINKLYLSQHKV